MYYVDLAVTGLSFGCMYAMMAVGLTLVYGLLRILHVAHAAVFALGAYITVIVANATGSVGLGFLAALVVTPLFGMAIYRLLYEPLLGYRPDVPMIASVGLLVLMQDAFRIAFGEQGVTFKNNSYAFRIFDIARRAGECRADRDRRLRHRRLHRTASLHHPHAHRHCLAGHGVAAEDRRELRRRCHQSALSRISRSDRRSRL